MKNAAQIDVHADDYGVSCHGAEDILECLKQGALDSISVIPNMSCFEKCVEMYQREEAAFPKKPLICVHLNLMDGKPVLPKEQVPDLVDEAGCFCLTWGKLFLLNYSIGKKKQRIKEQMKREFAEQMKLVQDAFGLAEIRLDSHQHPHMIPFVFDVLMELCDERKGQVTFVRVAKEPLMPFLLQVTFYPTYSPVNLIKNLLLNLYSIGARKKLQKRGITYELLWGLLMSGCMDEKRVMELLPYVERSARKKGMVLEILFHPGQMLAEEKSDEYRKEGFLKFYCSENRQEEKRAVKKLRGRR